MEVDRNGLEVLEREECLRLLAGASLGRVGLTSGALPMVLPVNFSGWSVAVTGVASEISQPDDLEAVRQMPVARWAPQGEEAVVAISTEIVSGRRITLGARRASRVT